MSTTSTRARRRSRVLGAAGLLAAALLLAACVPLWPTDGVLTVSAASPTSLTVAWPVPKVDSDTTVASYEVRVDDVVRATVPAAQQSVVLADLAPATSYAVAVRALDGKGQWSAPLTASARTAAASAAITEPRTISVAGVARRYRLDIPAGYSGDAGARLVVALHGGGGTPDGFATYTRLPQAAATHGFLVAYPEGTAGPAGLRTWNGGGCCGAAQTGNVDDVAFLAALRAELVARFHVPATALVGHSNGAIMAYRFACDRPTEVDGIGVYAGTLFSSPCAPVQPVSVLHVHGLADPNLPFGGGKGSGLSGATFPPVMDGIETFRVANGCGSSPAVASVDGVVTTTWSCAPGAQLRLVTIDDATHEWAGGVDTPLAGTPSTKVDATAAIAGFVDGL